MMAFTGAPLDLIKTVAAVLMLGDHINSALLEPPALLVWRFGRIAFPLFCFVLASHIARGMDARTQVVRLLVFGALTQPIFNAAFPWSPREALWRKALLTGPLGPSTSRSLLALW
jgi:hypothetical protein